jgi:hypothetical protein
MAWFLIIVLALLLALALLAVLGLVALMTDDAESERARIEMEVRRAERRLHDIAHHSFQAMLEEARSHDRVGRS